MKQPLIDDRIRPPRIVAVEQRERIAKDARGRKVFHDLAMEEEEHLGKREERYSALLQRDPQLESRPTFLFCKGAANGLFAEGAELDNDTREITIDAAGFNMPKRPARGSAEQILITDSRTLSLRTLNFTTCPEDDPDWLLIARDLKLDAPFQKDRPVTHQLRLPNLHPSAVNKPGVFPKLVGGGRTIK